MSDDAEQFYNAWVSVFGGKDLNKLLCAWHVDKAWRKALNENVAELQDRIEIYHYLRVLLIEVEEPKFRVALQQLLTILEENFIHISQNTMLNVKNSGHPVIASVQQLILIICL